MAQRQREEAPAGERFGWTLVLYLLPSHRMAKMPATSFRSSKKQRNHLPLYASKIAGAVTLLIGGSGLIAFGQAPDPGDSTKTLNLTTFATFSTAGASSTAIDLEHPKDGSGRIFVSVNEGKVLAFTSAGESLGTFLDLGAPGVLSDFDTVLNASTSGLSYMAFHPDYGRPGAAGEGKFYTYSKAGIPGLRSPDYSGAQLPTRPGDVRSQYAITEWTVDSTNPNQIDPSSHREVIRFEFSGQFDFTHSTGGLTFNPFAEPGDSDYGMLYIPLGDMSAGSGLPNSQHVQNRDNPFGKILRINPLANGGDAYSVPSDSPFNDGGSPRDNDNNTEEIFAWGFRNPQNLSFAKDSDGNARLVVFDIGNLDYEEVNIVDAGDNHGWPRHDGPTNGNLATTLNLPPGSTLEFPAAIYDHEFPNLPGGPPTAGSAAITGGFVVSDPNDPTFQNQLLFGDLVRGAFFHADFESLLAADASNTQAAMFVMNVSLDGSPSGMFTQLIGQGRGDARFGVDENGRLFVISRRITKVFRTDLVADQTPNTQPNVMGEVTGVVNEIAIRWTSVVGHQYTVEQTTDLNSPFSAIASNIRATPPGNVHTANVFGLTNAFFRVRDLGKVTEP